MPNISNITGNTNTAASTDVHDDGVRFKCSVCNGYVTPEEDDPPLGCDNCGQEYVHCDKCHPGEIPRGAVWLCSECR